jgi:hypothetical protein
MNQVIESSYAASMVSSWQMWMVKFDYEWTIMFLISLRNRTPSIIMHGLIIRHAPKATLVFISKPRIRLLESTTDTEKQKLL